MQLVDLHFPESLLGSAGYGRILAGLQHQLDVRFDADAQLALPQLFHHLIEDFLGRADTGFRQGG